MVFGFFEAHRFAIGMAKVAAGAKAQTICSYSKATRENIEVKLLANGEPVEGNNQQLLIDSLDDEMGQRDLRAELNASLVFGQHGDTPHGSEPVPHCGEAKF